ncbi:MAG: Ig-like domain-containing protein [Victivallaceae bacterium]|nr:Ig-like domain-containing protein [Victivallaceae bacterium]
MQTIILYVAAGGVVGALRDYANAKDASATAPMLARGVAAEIKLRLFAGTDRADAYPISELSNIAAWRFVLDNDFNSATAPLIVADNAAIAVATVTDTIEESERSYTEVTIPISAMDTEELAAAIGTAASITLGGELSGYDAAGAAVFLLQIDSLTVRNRRESVGEPTPVAGEYLTEAQTRALVSGKMDALGATSGADEVAAVTSSGGIMRTGITKSAMQKVTSSAYTSAAVVSGAFVLYNNAGGSQTFSGFAGSSGGVTGGVLDVAFDSATATLIVSGGSSGVSIPMSGLLNVYQPQGNQYIDSAVGTLQTVRPYFFQMPVTSGEIVRNGSSYIRVLESGTLAISAEGPNLAYSDVSAASAGSATVASGGYVIADGDLYRLDGLNPSSSPALSSLLINNPIQLAVTSDYRIRATLLGGGVSSGGITSVDYSDTEYADVGIIDETVLVTSIVVNGSSTITDSGTLTAVVTPSSATNAGVAWSSSDQTKATVTSGGAVTVLAAGQVTITASAVDGSGVTGSKTITCALTPVTVAVTGITITGASAITNSGTLTAVVTPSDASNPAVTWSSSNPDVATVSSSGVVTVLVSGSATITAASVSNPEVSGTHALTCTKTAAQDALVESIALSGAYTQGGANYVIDSATLTASAAPSSAANQAITWSSTAPDVATVTSGGAVTVLAAGSANIVAVAADGGGASSVYPISAIIAGTDDGVAIAAPVGILESGTLGITGTTTQLYQFAVEDNARATIDSATGAVACSADASGTSSCDLTYYLKRVTTTAGATANVASAAVPTIHEAAMVDLTGRVGYIPNFSAIVGFGHTVYCDFVMERNTASATYLFSDRVATGSGAPFVLARLSSTSGGISVACGGLRFARNSSEETYPVGSALETHVYMKTSTAGADAGNAVRYGFEGSQGVNSDYLATWSAATTNALCLGINLEYPATILGATANELASQLSSGTIVPKSAERAVKLKRLVIFRNQLVESAAVLASAMTADTYVVGTNDGRLLNLVETTADQPVISTAEEA